VRAVRIDDLRDPTRTPDEQSIFDLAQRKEVPDAFDVVRDADGCGKVLVAME
jgi:hypothetical protein